MNDFVGEARNALRETKADAELGIYVVPDVNGLTESLTGQRISDLARLVDWVAPMLYHNILLQPPTWIASALSSVVKVAGKKTLPVLQADSNRDPAVAGDWGPPMSNSDWSETLSQVAGRPEIDGLIVFPGMALMGERGDSLRAMLGPTAAMTDFANRPDAILRVEHISKSFGAVVALQDATLHLPTGEITGLVGDNGAGKSTLIKIISGVLTPDAGSIEFGGKGRPFRLARRGSGAWDRNCLSGPRARRKPGRMGERVSRS